MTNPADCSAQNREPIDVDRIEEARRTAVIGRKVVVFKSTASTNDIAWKYAAKPANHGLCVLAESQTRGRGRRGRKWHSGPGQSILCSILLLRQSIDAEILTLVAAVAAAQTISRRFKLACRIKWPNDILIGEKKMAGILVEKKTLRKENHFVIGIGINCGQTQESFHDLKLNLPATSLFMETGKPVDRTELVCLLLDRMEKWLARPAGAIIERWLELSGMLGRRVTIECDGKTFTGTCRGIDPAQGLILQPDRGAIQFFHAAHTSLLNA